MLPFEEYILKGMRSGYGDVSAWTVEVTCNQLEQLDRMSYTHVFLIIVIVEFKLCRY